MANTEKDREKALDSALAQIERQFGKGSLMRLGDSERVPIEVIPTGSIALDIALGMKGHSRFTRRFWTVNLNNSTAWQSANAERDVKCN